jgi:hypothetical protein
MATGGLKGRVQQGECMMKKRVHYIDHDELMSLWRMLERLQADVQPGAGGYNCEDNEREALVTVMDAVIDTYDMTGGPSLEEQMKAWEALSEEEKKELLRKAKKEPGR